MAESPKDLSPTEVLGWKLFSQKSQNIELHGTHPQKDEKQAIFHWARMFFFMPYPLSIKHGNGEYAIYR